MGCLYYYFLLTADIPFSGLRVRFQPLPTIIVHQRWKKWKSDGPREKNEKFVQIYRKNKQGGNAQIIIECFQWTNELSTMHFAINKKSWEFAWLAQSATLEIDQIFIRWANMHFVRLETTTPSLQRPISSTKWLGTMPKQKFAPECFNFHNNFLWLRQSAFHWMWHICVCYVVLGRWTKFYSAQVDAVDRHISVQFSASLPNVSKKSVQCMRVPMSIAHIAILHASARECCAIFIIVSSEAHIVSYQTHTHTHSSTIPQST